MRFNKQAITKKYNKMAKLKIIFIILCASFLFISCSKQIVEKVETSKSYYYTCPMHSEIFQTKPGHCPKCLMELVQWDPKQKRQQTDDSGHSSSGGGGGCH